MTNYTTITKESTNYSETSVNSNNFVLLLQDGSKLLTEDNGFLALAGLSSKYSSIAKGETIYSTINK